MRLSALRPLSSSFKYGYGYTKSNTASFIVRDRTNSGRVRNMATTGTGTSPNLSAEELGIESINDIQTASGVELDGNQKVLVGSVLDLFAGRPTLKKLSLWTETASFQDPITNSHGRKQYSAQWYGLPAVFSSITRLSHSVTSANTNPITLSLKTNYKLKGVGKETVIDSVVEIWVDEGDGEGGVGDKGKIGKVVDKWNGELPEGVFSKAFRNLNAVTVPVLVSVPKNEEEETKK